MKLIISTHFFFLSKIVKAFLLIKCHAKGFARERGPREGIRAGAGELFGKYSVFSNLIFIFVNASVKLKATESKRRHVVRYAKKLVK